MSDIETPSLSDVIEVSIDIALADLHTGIPGRVESYDESRQRASVQPLIRKSYMKEGQRVVERMPIINEVPIMFFGADDVSFTFPIKRGSIVWLSFAEASIDRWLAVGGDVDPDDDRRHSFNDAVAFPGLRHSAIAGVHPTATVITAPELRLGSKDAMEGSLKGDTFLSELSTLLGEISTAVGTIQNGGSAAKLDIDAAITAFESAVSSYLSSKIKVE